MDPFLPYLAGFFDGEGSIGIYRNGQRHGCTLRVQITQTVTPESTELLTGCRQRWGGSLGPFNRTLRRPAWNFQVTASKGIAMLDDIRPWLRLKAEQADYATDWWAQRDRAARGPDGRMLPMSAESAQRDREAEAVLKAMKHGKDVDIVMADAADLVQIEHTLRQFLNVKGQ